MKQTEVGLIPDDWEVIKFGDKVDIFRGGSPRPIERYITTNAYGINWIKIGDVRPNDKYIRQTEEKIIPEGKSRSREVKKGDFILSNSMSFGRPYILNIDGCIHDGWLTIQNYSESFDKEFLYYLLGSDEVFKQYVQMAAGSSVQNLNKEKVADLQLKVPPLAEQQRIAKALSDVDSLISTTEKLIQKKKNIKQGTMQNLLTGKKRLPGFEKSTRTKMTELGEIPEDWEVQKVSEFGSFCKGSGISREESNTGELPAVRYGELYTTHNDYIKTFESHISNEVASKSKRLKHGDLLFTCSGETKEDIGKCVAFLGNEEAYAGGDLLILSPNINIDSLFYGFLLNTNIAVKQKSSMAQGDAVVHISAESIGKVLVPFPPKEEQTAIANALSSMDKEIETLNTKLEKYRNLKTAMMQQLLTGKIRLV